MDLTFTAPIGVTVRGDEWSCVEVPDSKELFGTGKAVKVSATVDGEPLTVGCCPRGWEVICSRSVPSWGRLGRTSATSSLSGFPSDSREPGTKRPGE
ncbi:DUF1905 domain-containing protein [Arthrobacter echini]|uniref:DUF1905 domain-containing protein n=1 Tax=Arthrobacter echini TaxID=1529066 RepID=UPI001FE985BB|nr:DUF1905 domain-containing protein [Arthrobacter echini]